MADKYLVSIERNGSAILTAEHAAQAVFAAVNRNLTVTCTRVCGYCEGTGKINRGLIECTYCKKA